MSDIVGRQRWRHRLLGVTAVALLSLGSAAGCASDGASSTSPTPSSTANFAVTDPWVKVADSGMTAAFGTLVNNTDHDVTVVSVASPIASMLELHEVVEVDGKMVMQPKKGGFVVPAHGQHVLKPGGDHIMIIHITQPLKPGIEIALTLTFKDGSTVAFTAIAKEFAGGNESYSPSMGMMAGMG